MNMDPSEMSILSDVFGSIFNPGHDFIANVGAGMDNLLKIKYFQMAVVIVSAIFIGPAVAGLLGATGWTAVGISAFTGGLVGKVGFQGLGLGTFEQGFFAGA